MAENRKTAPSPGPSFNGGGVLRISRSAMKMKMGTWNVQSLFMAGKVHNVILELKRLNISILGISEMRWPGSGDIWVDEHRVFYSGGESSQHRNGVGFIVSKGVAQAVASFVPLSDRVALLRIHANPVEINLIQVYAPTMAATDQQIEEFYGQLDKAIRLTKKNEIVMIMGDFNSKIGKGRMFDVVGEHGLGVRNERGDRLLQFCQEEAMVITNTFFKLPKRRLYTWRSPADQPGNIVRNQIDFIMINKRFRNFVASCKTYPGADVPSDHNLLLTEVGFRPKKIQRGKINLKIDKYKLNNQQIKEEASELLRSKLENSPCENEETEESWQKVKLAAVEVAREKLIQDKLVAEKGWMTNEILEKMEKRRNLRNKDQSKYRILQREIRRDIRAAKEQKLAEDCAEIESMQKRHDYFGVHKKIKWTIGTRKPNVNLIEDKMGHLQTSMCGKLAVWKEYIEELFHDTRPMEHGIKETSSGPPITITEVKQALRRMKDGKAVGSDEVHIEVLKLMEENGLNIIVKLFNNIYNTGAIPRDWLKSTFITIPKKSKPKKCEEYRTISLMSHVLKLFLKIIHERIYRKLEERIGQSQFGFVSGLGTREALFSVQVLVQRCRDVNVDVHLCFIDFEKAFDKIKHQKLLDILLNTGMDDKDIRIIANLYWMQSARVRVDGELTDEVAILRGVRQGCVLSPLLFNIYSEEIFKQALEDQEEGIVLNGVSVNNIRYADDTLLIANTLKGLQQLLNRTTVVSEEYGLKLNVAKTKYMVIKKNTIPNVDRLYINNSPLETVQKIKYLGSTVNEKWDHSAEIRQRIEIARGAFQRMRPLLSGHNLSQELRLRLVWCYVFSVLLYGMEAWTLTEATINKVQAFEMWVYRRILRISWMDKVTNDEVLRRIKKNTELINTIKIRKLSYFGHIMCNPKYQFLQLVIQGKIAGHRGPGRRRTSWLKNLRQWFGKTSLELFRAAVNKAMIVNMIANIR